MAIQNRHPIQTFNLILLSRLFLSFTNQKKCTESRAFRQEKLTLQVEKPHKTTLVNDKKHIKQYKIVLEVLTLVDFAVRM